MKVYMIRNGSEWVADKGAWTDNQKRARIWFEVRFAKSYLQYMLIPEKDALEAAVKYSDVEIVCFELSRVEEECIPLGVCPVVNPKVVFTGGVSISPLEEGFCLATPEKIKKAQKKDKNG